MAPQNVLGLDATWWTAIGTLLLSVITGVYVVLTYRAMRAAVRASNHAARSAAAAEALLFVELAPVIDVKVVDFQPMVNTAPKVQITIRNVGRSAAVNGSAIVEFANGPALSASRVFDVLGPGEEDDPRILANADIIGAATSRSVREYSVTVHYQDLSGQEYRLTRTAQVAERISMQQEVDIKRRLPDGNWVSLTHTVTSADSARHRAQDQN